MKRNRIFALSALVAALAVGCGGDSGNGSAAGTQEKLLAGVTVGGVAPAATQRWMNVKYGGGGYVPGLIFHPTSPDVLYARTDVGGAYRWNPAAKAWIPLNDGMGIAESNNRTVDSLALDPNDDRLVYMVTGGDFNQPGRLYTSSDRGDNWQSVTVPFPVGAAEGRAIGERLMVDPNQPSTLFYGSRTSGLWKSTDSGKNWQQLTGLSSTKMAAVPDPTTQNFPMGVEVVMFDTSTKGSGTATQTIYTAIAPDYAAAAGLTYSMYKSTDGGATWAGVTTPVNGAIIPHMVRAKDGIFYVPFTKGPGPGAQGPASLYRFDGANWTLLKHVEPSQWLDFGFGGLSVSGTGATTRIALGVTGSWGNWDGQPVVQLSDDAGATWREISAMTPHAGQAEGWSGWVDDVEIDPNNPERVLHVHGGGVWETRNASAAKPTWTPLVDGIEETVNLGLMTPPPGANYSLLNSSGDVGMFVNTELFKTPTRSPSGWFSNGISADMAWSNPAYIATIGTTTRNHPNVAGAYSTDSGVTWTAFAGNHPDGLSHQKDVSTIAVTKPGNIIWAPSNSIPAYSTDNGTTWTYTNLPALEDVWLPRSYRLAADRKNPNRVYAFDSGGVWYGNKPAGFFVSNDGGHTFTRSEAFGALNTRVAEFSASSMAVNAYAEGDVWVTDGNSIYHTTDAGATFTKLNVTASIWGARETWYFPEVYGATAITLGKAPAGAKFSASLYVVGVINGQWGVHRSDDAGVTWQRYNDDAHQYGGISKLAASHTVPGRLFISGGGRGVLFRN